MQIVLTILFITAACAYLGWQLYRRFFAKNEACEGCAIGKTTGAQETKA